jgi:hypothetical protein
MKTWLKQIVIQLGVTIVALGLLFTLGAPIIANLSGQSGVAQKAVITLGFAGEAYAVTPDYQVDGTDDDVQVQTALNALPATGGRLVLFAGNWVFSATVSRAINNVTVEGDGKGTYLTHDAATPLFTAGAQTGWVFKDFRTDAGYLTLANDTSVFNVNNGTYNVAPSGEATFIVAASNSFSTEKASANWICDGTADDVEIQAAINAATNGGIIALTSGTYNIAATVTLPNKTLTIEGSHASILTGSVSPLISYPTGVPTGLITLKGFKVIITSTNTGISANQTWTAAPVTSLFWDGLWLYTSTDNGTLAYIYGTRESTITNCVFEGKRLYGTASIGLSLSGNTTGGAMNITIANNQFFHLSQPLSATGADQTHLAGLRVENNIFIGCEYGPRFANIDSVTFLGNMSDSNYYGIYFESIRAPNIQGNYINAISGADGINIRSTFYSTFNGIIAGNVIYGGGTATGSGIGILSSGQTIYDLQIMNNNIQNLQVAINASPASGAITFLMIIGNRIDTCAHGIYLTTATKNLVTENILTSMSTSWISGTGASNNVTLNYYNSAWN